jgi:hypothetical protein
LEAFVAIWPICGRFMAVVKVTWSIYTGGESGYSVLGPAIVGLMICVGLIYVGFRKLERHRTG